jgi:Bacterial Ig domain
MQRKSRLEPDVFVSPRKASAQLAAGIDMKKIASGIATMLALIAFFVTAQAQAQTQCPVIGSASTGGFPGTGYFDVSRGGACLFSLNINGEILNATIAKAPSNGSLNMVNVSAYTYTPNPGFTGTDAFVIEATGKDIGGPVGTSAITMNATVR